MSQSQPQTTSSDHLPAHEPVVIQIVGYKNTGKTTLVCRLIELLKREGYKVGTVKSDGHDFQMDTPGTDTWRHQTAGADVTAITSPRRSAILHNEAASLDQLLSHMHHVDFVLVEGFKHERYPKLVLVRTDTDAELLNSLRHVIAVVAWPEAEQLPAISKPLLSSLLYSINDTEGIAAFIRQ